MIDKLMVVPSGRLSPSFPSAPLSLSYPLPEVGSPYSDLHNSIISLLHFRLRFHDLLRTDTQMQNHLHTILALECTVRLAEECGREILKKMGNPTTTNLFYHCIK